MAAFFCVRKAPEGIRRGKKTIIAAAFLLAAHNI
jgi:hypothetical protein